MALPFDSIVFDLDGTLWDSCPACAFAWNEVLRKNRIAFRPITAEDVRAVTGKPHEACIRETFQGLPEDTLRLLVSETMVEDIRVLREKGANLYPGVLTGLAELSRIYPLLIVSNCQAGYIENFLEHTQLTPHFKDHESWGNSGRSKSENLRDLIARNELQRPLMVGDTEGDQKAARDCGVPFAFVQYGFGKCDFPDYAFRTFGHLMSFLGRRMSFEGPI